MEPDIFIDFPCRPVHRRAAAAVAAGLSRVRQRRPEPKHVGSIAALLALLAVLAPLTAGGGPRSVALKLSGTSAASHPAMAALPGGKIVVVWEGASSGPGAGVTARITNADGTESTPEIAVSATGTDPAVAADSDGNFLVAWSGEGDVFTRFFDVNGAPQRDGLRLNLEAAGTQSDPVVAAMPDAPSRFAVAFAGNGTEDIETTETVERSGLRHDSDGIWLRFTGAAGNEPVQTLVNAQYTDGVQAHPALVGTSNGVSVVWDGEGPGDKNGIFGARNVGPAQIETIQGSAVPLLRGVSPPPGITALSSVPGVQSDPDIAVAGSTLVVAWSGEGAGDPDGIWYVPFDDSARKEVRVNGIAEGAQQHPAIAAAGGSVVTIAWDGTGLGDDAGIYARRFDLTMNGGRPLTPEFLVNTPASGTQTNPVVARTDVGQYTVVFDSQTGDDPVGVFARPYNVNDPPVAVNDTYTIDEDATLVADGIGAHPAGVLGNDVEPDGDSMTAFVSDPPTHGTLQLDASGTFTYTPDANYGGQDSFEYRVKDSRASQSTPARVTITIGSVDDGGPVTAADDFTGAVEDTKFVVDDPEKGLLANDSDPDFDDVLIAKLRPNSTARSGRVVVMNDGTFHYTPDPNFCGDDTFQYVVTDGTTTSNPTNATIHVRCVKDPPGARDDHYATTEDTDLEVPAPGVLQNDFLDNGTLPKASVVEAPKHGKLTAFREDGSFVYRPDPDFNGTDVFTYQVTDASAPPPSPPPSSPPPDSGEAPDPGVLPEIPGVPGVPGVPGLPGVTGASAGAGGRPAQTADGSAPAGSRQTAASAPGSAAQVVIRVGQTEDSPLVSHDAYFTPEDTPMTITVDKGVLANDSDPDLGTLTARLATPPSRGKLTSFNPDGSFSYEPYADFNGVDVFTYEAANQSAKSSAGKVELLVGPQGDRIVATPDRYQVQEDTALTVPAPGVLANDIDPDGGRLILALIDRPTRGTVELNTDGSFVYAPAADTSGVDRFSYRVSDPDGNEATAEVVILVRAAEEDTNVAASTSVGPAVPQTPPPPPPPAVQVVPATPLAPPPLPPPSPPASAGGGASGGGVPPPPPPVTISSESGSGSRFPVPLAVAGGGAAGLAAAIAGITSRRRSRLEPLETLPL